MRVTVEYLESLRNINGQPPCKLEIRAFKKFLGKRKWVLPTPRNLSLASDYLLNIDWFIYAVRWTGKIEYTSGRTEYWVDGKLHRDGGLPAVEYTSGKKEYWVDDKLHRDGGLPAVEYTDGTKEYWVRGKYIR
jgi:hypothetical protein